MPPIGRLGDPIEVEAKRAVWAHRHDGRTDLVFLGRGVVRLSHALDVVEPVRITEVAACDTSVLQQAAFEISQAQPLDERESVLDLVEDLPRAAADRE